ncbi:MAG: hypothetical protein M1829_004177 [Trizodia sp. TS-e1964]|nr:MAG: hypothetical protein M1829_004177 [Trizodia sp. TS-e1964]
MKISSLALWLGSCLALVAAWTPQDHEIFRLNDEVAATEGPGVTFYEFVGVSPSASQDEITKAFRKKSKSLHPDKIKQSFIASKVKESTKTQQAAGQKKKKPGVNVTKAPTQAEIKSATKLANERFARLGVVARVLRGPERERYDYFLTNGFPKWRGTNYYYARFRPGLGSVLLGLFVIGGGGFHYGILYLSWKQHKEFVGKTIRHARREAFGDESGISAIPGLEGTATPYSGTENEDSGMPGLNRKERRAQAKESKKETKKGKGGKDGDSTPLDLPRANTQRRTVRATNGKDLVVDSAGSVYLLEEDEDGVKQEYLLRVEDIARPTIKETFLYRLPLWLLTSTAGRLGKSKQSAPEGAESDDSGTEDSDELVSATKKRNSASSAMARRRAKNSSGR